MSYPNEELTIHSLEHMPNHQYVENCDYCQMSWIGKNKYAYETELRHAWGMMIEKYPHLYSNEDYFKACEQVGITIF